MSEETRNGKKTTVKEFAPEKFLHSSYTIWNWRTPALNRAYSIRSISLIVSVESIIFFISSNVSLVVVKI